MKLPKSSEAKRDMARQLAGTIRGHYILGQALAVAVATMKKVPEPFRETSNIADMELLGEMFEPFYSLAKPGFMAEAMQELEDKLREEEKAEEEKADAEAPQS